jgi:hypothetical protein
MTLTTKEQAAALKIGYLETMTAADLELAICEYFNVSDASIDTSGDIWVGTWVSHDQRDACLAWINRGDAMVSRNG